MGRDVRRVPSSAELRAGLDPKSWNGTAWQIWKSVTIEGSPISPIFDTREELIDWLVNDGSGMGVGGCNHLMTRAAAERFVNAGHASSILLAGDGGCWCGLRTFEDGSHSPLDDGATS